MLNDELIGAYLDGELDAEKRALVEHWLASDKGAARRLVRMRSADAMVRLAVPRVATPENDLLSLQQSQNARYGCDRSRRWRRPVFWALCWDVQR
jgi:anti-sigma factor RsiW